MSCAPAMVRALHALTHCGCTRTMCSYIYMHNARATPSHDACHGLVWQLAKANVPHAILYLLRAKALASPTSLPFLFALFQCRAALRQRKRSKKKVMDIVGNASHYLSLAILRIARVYMTSSCTGS